MLLAACGGGGGGGSGGSISPALVPPVLSNLSYSPTSAYVNAGNGSITVTGTVNVTGANKGVKSVTISVLDAAGTTVSTSTAPVVNGGALTNGTLQGTVIAGTSTAGNYQIRVSLLDISGLTSNTLSGTFRIAAHPWSSYSAMPHARAKFALAASGGLAYAIGGELLGTGSTPGPASDWVEVYDPSTHSWTTSATRLPTARMAATAAAVNGVIYVIGGVTLAQPGGLGVVEAFDTNLQTWSTKASMPTARYDAASAVVNGKICVMGGQSAAQDLSTTECFDPVANRWAAQNPMPTFRRNLAADTVGSKIYAVGGYSGSNLSGGGLGTVATTEAFDSALNFWSLMAPMATPRESFAASGSGGLLYAFGGGNAADRTLQTVEAYDPSTNRWKAKTDMPTPLSGLLAVGISGTIHVFGPAHTLAYNPANDLL